MSERVKIAVNTRKISEVKKEVNRLGELGEKEFILETNLELGSTLKNKNDRNFLGQLVAMSIDMEDRKKMNFEIVVSYGKMRLSKFQIKRIKNKVRWLLLHPLAYSKTTFKINTSHEKGEIFKNIYGTNIIENNDSYLVVGSAEIE